ncbi:MAG: acylneuraminate cytidylyltransferase family protein [Vampirovibrionia bacterium]
MLNNKIVHALIPARAGSTRLQGKNIKLLNGKPLIAYTIEQANKSKYLDKVVVSTDSKEIADVSISYNAEVPFLRPSDISDKKALPHSYLTHYYSYLSDNNIEMPDITVLLQPTSPLRLAEDIDKSIELLSEKDCDQVLGVYLSDKKPYWYKTVDDSGYLNDYASFTKSDIDKQSYLINGAIYAFKTSCFRDNIGVAASKVYPYIMPQERSVDIDTEIDFELASLLLKRALN